MIKLVSSFIKDDLDKEDPTLSEVGLDRLLRSLSALFFNYSRV